MNRIYVAGPMRGLHHFNFESFYRAESYLRSDGWEEVVNPARHDVEVIGFDPIADDMDGSWLPAEFSLRDSMAWDLDQLVHCTAIALLPGWEGSKGAKAEHRVALALDLRVITLTADRIDLPGVPGYEPAPLAAWKDEPDPHHPDFDWENRPARVTSREVRVTSDTGGQKGKKPAQFSLIPPDVLELDAIHYGYGEEKYPSDANGTPNWQLGYSWRLNVDALQRHLHAFLQGEDMDEESGSYHLTAVRWHAAALLWFTLHGKGTDDLPGRKL